MFGSPVVSNTPPLANAGPDQTIGEAQFVTLDGTLSRDTNTPVRPLSYAWSQLSGPAVLLAGGSTVSPTFTAPGVGLAASLRIK